jgi:predicted TIM-barrel fold metal-dependent hydrolase
MRRRSQHRRSAQSNRRSTLKPLDISDGDRRKIFAGNAKRLLRLPAV